MTIATALMATSPSSFIASKASALATKTCRNYLPAGLSLCSAVRHRYPPRALLIHGAAVKPKRRRQRNAVGGETTRVLAYALSGVAKEFARLLRLQQTRRQSALTRRGGSGMSQRCVFRLLCRAFNNAL